MGVFEELGLSVEDLLVAEGDNSITPPPPPPVQFKPVPQAVKPKAVAPEVLSDVEKRLEKANCYKVLLMDGLFEDAAPGTPAGEVQKEVRDFVRNRLEVLLGMAKPVVATPASMQFTHIEATILKAIVKKLVAQNTPEMPEVATAEEKLEQLVQAMPPEPAHEPEPIRTTPRLKRPRAKKESGVEPVVEVVADQEVVQKVTLPNGAEFELKSKPQARPAGVQPLPTLTPQQAERSYHSLALGHAQTLAGNGVVADIAQRAVKT